MPYVPQDLLDRVASLEREVRQLRGRAQIRPALDQVLHGDVTIGEGGRLLVEDPSGDRVFETGQSAAGDWYVTLRRDNGVPAIGIGANTFAGDDAVRQMVRLFSRSRQIIVMDDYYADDWLGRPFIPVPWQPTGSTWDFPGTSDGVAWNAYIRAQNPVAYLRTTTGTTADATVTLEMWNLTTDAPVQIIDTWTVPAGTNTPHNVSFPLDGASHLDELQFRILHRSNGGLVSTDVIGCVTRNTFSESEIPT